MPPDPPQDQPRWTLPPRKEISPENLHISSFVIARRASDGDKSILLLKAGDKHPLSFRRGKLLLPATILAYGEKPREGARRALREQLQNTTVKALEFLGMQSYLGAHWDIVILFGTRLDVGAKVAPNGPFVEAAFYDANNLPRAEIAEDHLEVIDEMLHPSDED